MKRFGQIISVLIKRWTSKSPKLYAKITNWALIIGVIVGTVLLLPVSLPAWLISILTFLAALCGAISGGYKFTTEDEEVIKETKKVLSIKGK